MSSHTTHQIENHSEARIHLVESRGLLALLIASICLVATTFSADRLASMYLDRPQQIHSWNLAVRYSDAAAGFFMVLQMIIVVIVFGIAEPSLRIEKLKRLLRIDSVKPLLWGALVGLVVCFISSPLFLLFDKHIQFVRLLLDNPFSFQTILIVFLLMLLVPITTEVVFRGIIFDVLARRTNAPVALIVSSLLFAYVWVLFNAGFALLIGIACALLYRRFNSLVPGIACSGIATVFATLILFLRLLFQA